jgi:glutamyl-tRNA reductase
MIRHPKEVFQDLMLVHRATPAESSAHARAPLPYDGDLVLWETCLRKILVGPTAAFDGVMDSISVEEGDEIYTGVDAYRFLLEILCGLRSRILGENEIVGQFKKRFLEMPLAPAFRSRFAKLPQMLLSDMKKIRKEFPLNGGNHSYGSFVRKELRDGKFSSIALIGSGDLAASIYPWVAEEADLTIIHRSESGKARFIAECPDAAQVARFVRDAASEDFDGLLVIAAPVAAESVVRAVESLGRFHPSRVLDLRGECVADPLVFQPGEGSPEVIDLNAFFSQAKHTDEIASARKQLVLAEIASLTESRQEAESIQFRTQGWEDLCG